MNLWWGENSSDHNRPIGLFFLKLFIYLFVIIFWPHRTACEILVPPPGIEPMSPAVEAQSLNHWTAREVPGLLVLKGT